MSRRRRSVFLAVTIVRARAFAGCAGVAGDASASDGGPRSGPRTARLNGTELALGAGDALPVLTSATTPVGRLELAPATITFLAMSGAGDAACR